MNLRGRRTDTWGNVIFTEDGLVDHALRGGDLHGLPVDETDKVKIFNRLCREFDRPEDQLTTYTEPTESVEEWDKARQSQWFTPEPFATIDVLEWLYERCTREEEILRVQEEWAMFEERGMEPVLRFLIYMIDHFRKNKVVWGVGRGSSVASYSLYLIGVHKIDSLKYNLDPKEFLK